MNTNILNTPSPLNGEQRYRLNELLNSLDANQMSWLAGYLAALNTFPLAEIIPQPTADDAQNPVDAPLLILFGSMTGNAEDLAALTAEKAAQMGLRTEVRSMAACSADELRSHQKLLVIVSTYGEGSPPTPAKELHRQLFAQDAPQLKHLNYAVLALGDSTYPRFCQAGIDFDLQLEKLGARRLQPLHLGDYDVALTAPAWLDRLLPFFGKLTSVQVAKPGFALVKPRKTKGPDSVLNVRNTLLPKPKQAAPLPSKSNPFLAPVLEKFNLHGPGSERQTLHLVLQTDVPGMDFKPGDSAGILPINPAELVQEVLVVTGFDGQQSVQHQNKLRPLEAFLRDAVELSKVTPDVIRKYRAFCQTEAFQRLADDKAALASYLEGRDIVDLLTEHPTTGWTPENLLSVLRPLQPRLYSISSSPLEYPGQLHLTVGVVAFGKNGRNHRGTCSTYLSEVKLEDEHIPVFIESNPNFRLPEDPSIPILMLGAGTGIAPYRAFVQHRAHQSGAGKSWLFFGNRHSASEFLYREEWEQHLQAGRLTRMDVAFSRDGNQKRYVQHALEEHAAEVYQWLEAGAYLYLCGDMNGFANDVQRTLTRLVAEQGHLSEEEAERYLEELQVKKRFQIDVY